MAEVGAFEAKNTLSALLDRVERGEEIVITRHGKPIARLVPSTSGIDRSEAHAAIQCIRGRVSQIKLGQFDWKRLKAERDTGRP